MTYDLEAYIEDWTIPLPSSQEDAFLLRVEVEAHMHQMRLALVEIDVDDQRVRDPQKYLKRTNYRYRALSRLMTRLNLLLRYFGFSGGYPRQSASDFLPMLCQIARTFDLNPTEKALINWIKMFLKENHPVEFSQLKNSFPPDITLVSSYDDIRQSVLDNFTGNPKDIERWEGTPEFWVAQDEWHTERIRRERLAKRQREHVEVGSSQK